MYLRSHSQLAGLRLAGVVVILCAPLAMGDEPVVNEWCPVMTEEKADPTITIEYAGKTIAFCCDTCLTKFRVNPDKYLDRLPQFSSGRSTDSGEASEHQTEHPGEEAPGGGVAALGAPGGHDPEGDGHSDDGAAGEWLGRLHPIVVHFPVAGVPLALLGFVIWSVSGRKAFESADVAPLLVGAGAAIVAVVTGNIAHDSMRFSSSMQDYADWHQYAGTALMILTLLLAAIRIWRWNRLAGPWSLLYGGGLLVVTLLVGVTGFLGGSLVFGPDHFGW